MSNVMEDPRDIEMKELQDIVSKLLAAQSAKDSTIDNLCKKVEDLTEYKTNIVRSQQLSEESREEYLAPGMVRIHLESRTDPRTPWTAQLMPDPENPSRWTRKFLSFDDPSNVVRYNRTEVKVKVSDNFPNGKAEVIDYSITANFPKDAILEQQTGIGRMYFLVLGNGETQRISGRDAFAMAKRFVDNRKEPVELADNRKQAEEDMAPDALAEIPF